MIVQIKKQGVATLPQLLRLVLLHIYEPEKLSLVDEKFMQSSMISWANHAMPTEDEVYYTQRLGWLLKENMEGRLEDRKRAFKEYGINYKKFHRLPEAYVGMTNDRRREIEKIKETERTRRI